MGIYISKSCPNCGKTLEHLKRMALYPGVCRSVTCPSCKTKVVLSDDPSWSEASLTKKALYVVATVKTLLIYAVIVYLIGGCLWLAFFK